MAEAKRSKKLDALADVLSIYEVHGRPLEADHWGEFLAVSPDGETMLDTDYEALFQRAISGFGEDITFFKIGEVAVGSLRWSRL
jgi:hypothetical protein